MLRTLTSRVATTTLFALSALGLSGSVRAQLPTRYQVTLISSSLRGGDGPKISYSGAVNMGGAIFISFGTAPSVGGRLVTSNPTLNTGFSIADTNLAGAYVMGGTLRGGSGSLFTPFETVYTPSTGFASANASANVTTTGMGGVTLNFNAANNEAVGSVSIASNSPYGLYYSSIGELGFYYNGNSVSFGILAGLTSTKSLINKSEAVAIKAGKAVGFSTTADYKTHAVWWATPPPSLPYAGVCNDYGTLLNSGDQSACTGTNGNYVIGYSNYTPRGAIRATLFQSPTTNQDLGTLGGGSSCANDINSSNTIVGYSYTTSGVQHAFIISLSNPIAPFGPTVIQSGKTLNDLNDYVPGAAFITATGINDRGQIVVYGTYNSLSGWYLLSPY